MNAFNGSQLWTITLKRCIPSPWWPRIQYQAVRYISLNICLIREFLEKVTVDRDDDGQFHCPACNKAHEHPDNARRHYLNCWKKMGWISGNVFSSVLESVPDAPQLEANLESEYTYCALTSEINHPSDSIEIRQEEVEQVAPPLDSSLRIPPSLKEKCPHVAVHQPTGMIFCIQDRTLMTFSRFVGHCQFVRHAFDDDVFDALAEEVTALEIIADDIGTFFRQRVFNGPLEFLGTPLQGFKCGCCSKISKTKDAMRKHYESTHPGQKSSNPPSECVYQTYTAEETHPVKFEVANAASQLIRSETSAIPGFKETLDEYYNQDR